MTKLAWIISNAAAGFFRPLCTDIERTPEQIITWFVRRWRIETTFGEVRAHLGTETQRQ